MLLHPDTWRGLSLDAYHKWAEAVWHILALRTSRRSVGFPLNHIFVE